MEKPDPDLEGITGRNPSLPSLCESVQAMRDEIEFLPPFGMAQRA